MTDAIEFTTAGARTTKVCRICGTAKPIEEFRLRNTRTGCRRTECKRCCSEYGKKHYQENREKHLKTARRWVENNRERNAAYKAQWARENRDRLRVRGREVYHANIETGRAAGRRRARKYLSQNRNRINERRRAEYALNPEPHRKRSKNWSKNNPDKRRAIGLRRRKRLALWRKENNDKVNVWTRNRRAKIKKAEGKHSHEDIQRLLESHRGRCYWCRRPRGDNYHVDHVTPISKGGANHIGNLCISCATCNITKGAKMPDQFGGILL